MSDRATDPKIELSHTTMTEGDALHFLGEHRIRLGSRTMDPKAQIVGEFVKSVRVPGYFPPLPELRQQLRLMVTLMDEPAPALPRVEDIRIPGPDGGADPALVAVAGDSAGGNLAAVVSQLAASSGTPVPTCQALVYPALDFSLETDSHRDLVDGHVIPRDRILWYMEQYLRSDADKADRRASPLRAPSLAGQPPTLIVTAGFDPLRDEGRAYGDRLREAGVDVAYREYPGQLHAFVSLTKAIPQGMACTLEIAEYLRQRVGR